MVLISLGVKTCVGVISGLREEKRDDLILSIDRGSAEVIVAGQADSAAQSQLVFEGDAIRTDADSAVMLSLQNGSQMILDESTHLTFQSVTMDGQDDHFEFTLHDGRVWVEHLLKEEGALDLTFATDVIDVQGDVGSYLISNRADDEYVYVFEGGVNLEFVDRGQDDVVIESVNLVQGTKSLMDDEKERDLLSHENLVFSELIEEDEFLEDEFVLWNLGEITFVTPESEESEEKEAEEDTEEDEELEEEPEEEPEEEEEEDVVEEEVTESLAISITSPASPFQLDGDAIAIEGRIVSGAAQSVTVTWSGNGQAYPLGLFEPGSDSFRYVADVNYANIAEGSNTYTIVAYDEEGNASNVLSVQIEAIFPVVVE